MLIEFVIVTIALVIVLLLLLAHVWAMALEKLTRGRGWKLRSGWTFFMTFVFDMLMGLLGGIFIAAFIYTVYGLRIDHALVDAVPVLLWMYGLYWWLDMPDRVTAEEERAFYAEMAAKGEKPLIAPSWDNTPLPSLSTAFCDALLIISNMKKVGKHE